MKDTSYVIIYVYYSNRISFLYINYNDNNRVIRSVVASPDFSKLTSCKILHNTWKYLCTCNRNGDDIILYIIHSSTGDLSVRNYKYSISELNGYIDAYLYDTLILTTKLLCAKKINYLVVNCWLCKIS